MFSSIKSRFARLVLRALKQGSDMEGVCRATGLGVGFGIFPIYGVTTATLGMVGVVAKLNHALLQGVNYLVGPLKLAMIYPFIRLGEFMWRESDPFRLSLTEFTSRFQAAPVETLSRFSMTFVHAITGWLVVAPFVYLAVYLLMKHSIRSGHAVRQILKEKTA